jgi:hypothetical protein
VSLDRCEIPPTADAGSSGTRDWLPSLVADLVVVVLFALAGRVSHDEGNLVMGTVGTAAPFALGLMAGWLRAPCAGMPTAQRARSVRFGWWLLAWTMSGGVLFRWVIGDGLAPAFLLVAAAVLTLGLVGRRWAVALWINRGR